MLIKTADHGGCHPQFRDDVVEGSLFRDRPFGRSRSYQA